MPLSLRTRNLLKRLFPKQVEGHNTVKFPNIQVSLTDDQVEKLTQLFEAQLKFHHNNKKQASDLHLNSIVPRDRFLSKLWDERFENEQLLSALVKIYSNFEKTAIQHLVIQTINAMYHAVRLVYEPISRRDSGSYLWASYQKMKWRERRPALIQVSNQSPLVQAVKKIHENLYEDNRVEGNGELEVARHLSHFCSITIDAALLRLPAYTFLDNIKYLIELFKDRDYFERSRLNELTDALLTQGLLSEEIDPEIFRLYSGKFIVMLDQNLAKIDMESLMSAQEHELKMAIFINDILYSDACNSESNIKHTMYYPENLSACARHGIDGTWMINQINERAEGMLTLEEFKRAFSHSASVSSSLNEKELSALFFVNHSYVNSYIKDHRDEIDQLCTKLGLKSSIELQYIVHCNPNIQYKDFIDRSKISTPVRFSVATTSDLKSHEEFSNPIKHTHK